MPSSKKELINPVRVFFAILIVVIIWFAPVVNNPAQDTEAAKAAAIKEDIRSLITVPGVSADPPDVCSDECKVWYCADKIPGGGCREWTFHCAGCDHGGGSNQPPTISHILSCTQNGSNGWCIGNLSLDLTASDPQGSQVIISGDVNGTAFVCSAGNTTCSVPLPEGAGNTNYRVDAATTGLTASGTTTYLLDSSTPQLNGSVSGVVGTGGWYKSNVTLSVISSDLVSGIASTTVAVDGGPQTTYSTPIVLTDGVHTVALSATDNAGHVTQTTQSFSIDTVTPVLNISLSGTMGANNWYISNVTLTASSSDSGSGLAALEVSQDGSAYSTYQSPITFSDGVHSYQFRATDNAGNVTESGQTLNIDTTTPTLNISTTGVAGLNPSTGSGESGWYVSSTIVTPTAADATSGIATFEISQDNSAFTNYQSPITFSDGIHSYTFKVTDNAGNITESTQTVKVDTVTPSLSLNINGTRGQNDWYVSSASVTPTATDATSGIASLEVSQDGSAYTAYQSTTFSDGLHTYRFKATDNAGNVTETPAQNLKVDTIAPVIEMMDELKLGEYLYYDLEDPTVAGQENSGLSIYRAVIEDDDEKYKKIVWLDGLEGDKARDSILWDGKFADGTQAGWGDYFITLKISDAAGNERMRTAIVKVGLLSFLEEIPAFTPPASASTTLPAQTAQTESAAVTEFGGTNSGATGETTSESASAGGANNAATGAESASISAGGTAVFNNDADYVQSGFTQGNQSASTPITNTNPSTGSGQAILWGAVAAATLGATLADWQRRREEEEARKRAEAAAQEEEGGRSGKKKTPGQIAYEKTMKQKRIVGESQAMLNEKAREKAEQAEKARQNLIAKNEDRAPVDMAKVNQLVEEKADLQAGLLAYYEGRKKGEEKKNTGGPKVLAMPVKQDGTPPPPAANLDSATLSYMAWAKAIENGKSSIPAITVFPTNTVVPVKNPVYAINGPMTVDQIPLEFKCTLPEKKVIDGRELWSDYYKRCKIGEQLMEGLLTDPNGWWWKNGETKHWLTGNLTHWEGIKSNEDVWKLAVAIGLDGEGTDLRLNDSVFGDYLKIALYNRFWHFDKTQIATYENVPDPSAQPLGTNGRLTVLGALESIQIRVTEDGNGFVSRGLPASEVILPPYDDYITNDWESAWNGNTDLFKDEPQIGFIKPADPFDFGNPTPDMNPEIKKALNQGNIGEGYNQILYSYEGKAYVLTFEQKMYFNAFGE